MMDTKKILFGGITGGLVLFFLGWIIFGKLIAGYMETNYNQHMMRTIIHYKWDLLILSNLFWGFLIATIFGWSKISGWKEGAKKGFLLGLLISLSIDLGNFATTLRFFNMGAMLVDIAATTLWITIGSIFIALAMYTGKKLVV